MGQGGGALDRQVAGPRSDAAALAGPAEPPRVHADARWRLVHLHPGGGDAAVLLLAPPSTPAACIGGGAWAAAP